MMKSVFGRQPAYDKAKEQGRSLADLDRETNAGYTHTVNALNGRCRPNDELRERLPEILGVPLEECFTPEAIGRPFIKRGQK